jgi:arylsulfatase
VPTFTDPTAKTGHNEQYFEIFGNRAIYQDGWVAAARRYVPWELFTNPATIYRGHFDQDRWELYHVDVAYSEAHDLASQMPRKLAQMKAEFDKVAHANDIYPLTPLPLLGAPMPTAGRTHFSYAEGVERIPLAVTPDLTARAFRLTADVEVPQGGGDGVITAEGGRYGGFALFVKGGKLIFENNTFGTTHQQIVSTAALAPGRNTIELDFTPDGNTAGGIIVRRHAGPGSATLRLNGADIGQQHFAVFGGFASAIDEPLDIGRDTGSAVSSDYAAPNPYAGHVTRVTIDLL